MIRYLNQQRQNRCFPLILGMTILSFILNGLVFPLATFAQNAAILNLPAPGSMVSVTAPYMPMLVKGLQIHADNPLKFDFIIDKGDSGFESEAFRDESAKLIRYFLASLTVPEREMWVNLSPYQKDRIIPSNFGETEMGRDLLSQDYMLKQLTASLMSPKEDLGDEFWARVHRQAFEKFGTTDIPMNTFNKIWIVPQEATIYEHERGAFIVKSYLKVMLEEDYLALEINQNHHEHGLGDIQKSDLEVVSGISAQVVREVLIPEIEKEVNQGKIFANLRQIYHSMLLATWYKRRLKESLLGDVYIDQGKTHGIDLEDKEINQKIYNQYVEAFEKGVYDFIREDYDPATQQMIARKYFSGGVNLGEQEIEIRDRQDHDVVDAATMMNDPTVVVWEAQAQINSAPSAEEEIKSKSRTQQPEQHIESKELQPDLSTAEIAKRVKLNSESWEKILDYLERAADEGLVTDVYVDIDNTLVRPKGFHNSEEYIWEELERAVDYLSAFAKTEEDRENAVAKAKNLVYSMLSKQEERMIRHRFYQTAAQLNIKRLKSLKEKGVRIVGLTARPESVREQTMSLLETVGIQTEISLDKMLMVDNQFGELLERTIFTGKSGSVKAEALLRDVKDRNVDRQEELSTVVFVDDFIDNTEAVNEIAGVTTIQVVEKDPYKTFSTPENYIDQARKSLNGTQQGTDTAFEFLINAFIIDENEDVEKIESVAAAMLSEDMMIEFRNVLIDVESYRDSMIDAAMFSEVLRSHLGIEEVSGYVQSAIKTMRGPDRYNPKGLDEEDLRNLSRVSKDGVDGEEIFFVHAIQPKENFIPAEFSFLKRGISGTMRADIVQVFENITLAASSIRPGDPASAMFARMGFILSGGRIEYAAPADVKSHAKSITKREVKGSGNIAKDISIAVKGNPEKKHDEFGVSGVKIAGAYINIDSPDKGHPEARVPVENFVKYTDDWSMPLYLVKDGRIYDYDKEYYKAKRQLRILKTSVFNEETNDIEYVEMPLSIGKIIDEDKYKKPVKKVREALKSIMWNSPFNISHPERDLMTSWEHGRSFLLDVTADLNVSRPTVDTIQVWRESDQRWVDAKVVADIQGFGNEVGRRTYYVMEDEQGRPRLMKKRVSFDSVGSNEIQDIMTLVEDERQMIKKEGDPVWIGVGVDVFGLSSKKVVDIDSYLEKMAEEIYLYDQGYESYMSRGAEDSAQDFKRVIRNLAFHLYGFAYEANYHYESTGNAWFKKIRDRALVLSRAAGVGQEEYEKVLRRRLSKNGTFKIKFSDIGAEKTQTETRKALREVVTEILQRNKKQSELLFDEIQGQESLSGGVSLVGMPWEYSLIDTPQGEFFSTLTNPQSSSTMAGVTEIPPLDNLDLFDDDRSFSSMDAASLIDLFKPTTLRKWSWIFMEMMSLFTTQYQDIQGGPMSGELINEPKNHPTSQMDRLPMSSWLENLNDEENDKDDDGDKNRNDKFRVVIIQDVFSFPFEYLKKDLDKNAVIFEPSIDKAGVYQLNNEENVGGIDLNPGITSFNIEKNGKGFKMPDMNGRFSLNNDPESDITPDHIKGFVPVIINIMPVSNVPLLLGLTRDDDTDTAHDFLRVDPDLPMLNKNLSFYSSKFLPHDV